MAVRIPSIVFLGQNVTTAVTDCDLTLYHTILTFNTSGKESFFGKIAGKGENAGYPAFSPFPSMFSTLCKTSSNFLFKFILLFANAFNLDQCFFFFVW